MCPNRTRGTWFGLGAILVAAVATAAAPADRPTAGAAPPAAKGADGFCLVLGCRDGELPAELAQGRRLLVQALALDEDAARKARDQLQARRLYGQVSVGLLPAGPLPYADDLANLVVVDQADKVFAPGGVSLAEVWRILCPRGFVCVRGLPEAELNQQLARADLAGVKPVQADDGWAWFSGPDSKLMDEWTHQDHDADGNTVSRDLLVEPSSGFRWLAGPYYPLGLRSDDTVAAVLAAGRLYYISASETSNLRLPLEKLPLRLVARDAFNGVLLWTRPFKGMVPLEPGPVHTALSTPQDRKYAKPEIPMGVGNRQPFPLVAAGQRVYTCEMNAVALLDGPTGKTLAASADLDSIPDTILHHDGSLYVSTEKCLYAMDAAALSVRWRLPVQAMDPTIGGGRLFFLDTARRPYDLVAVDLKDGKQLWRTEAGKFYPRAEVTKKKLKGAGERGWNYYFGAGALDKVKQISIRAYCDLAGKAPAGGPEAVLVVTTWDALCGASADDGRLLWNYGVAPHGKGFNKHAFFIKGLVWTAEGPPVGLDPLTGKERERKLGSDGSLYYRCGESAATERYFISGRQIAFVPVVRPEGEPVKHSFPAVRGSCRIGVIPACGLLYNFPMSCTCLAYNVRGFQALAGEEKPAPKPTPDDRRLVRGPAFGQDPKSEIRPSTGLGAGNPQLDWPTFKGDFRRSGGSAAALPADLQTVWSVKLAEPAAGPLADDWNADGLLWDPLTSPTAAEGKVFTALPNDHQVRAVSLADGKGLWAFTAGGRIDSSPTIHNGRCIFGCTDGWVYCLAAEGGRLVWKFQAAPRDRRIVSHGQVESLWPVCGSVLVVGDVAYFVAGRSSLADGGLIAWAVSVEDGRLLWKQPLGPAPERGGFRGQGDVLVSDGLAAYLCTGSDPLRFDLKTGQHKMVPGDPPNSGYLMAKEARLLEGTWRRAGGALRPRKGHRLSKYAGAEGALIAFNDSLVVGYEVDAGGWRFPNIRTTRLFGRPLVGKGGVKPGGWSVNVAPPAMIESILLAGDTLFAAGPVSAYEPRPGRLLALSAADGKTLKTLALPAPPVYEGLAAVDGRLLIALQDGTLLCLGKP